MKRTTQLNIISTPEGPHPPAILTNDPSFTAWGWAVLTLEGEIIDTGCIKTIPSNKKLKIRKGDDRCRRISEINQRLLALIKKYNVVFILSEQPHGSQSAVAAIMIGVCLGIVQTIGDVLNIGIEWYSEQDSKKCLLEKRSATKEETINAISKLYFWKPSGVKYIDEAVADALSIYYVANKQSATLRLFKNEREKNLIFS